MFALSALAFLATVAELAFGLARLLGRGGLGRLLLRFLDAGRHVLGRLVAGVARTLAVSLGDSLPVGALLREERGLTDLDGHRNALALMLDLVVRTLELGRRRFFRLVLRLLDAGTLLVVEDELVRAGARVAKAFHASDALGVCRTLLSRSLVGRMALAVELQSHLAFRALGRFGLLLRRCLRGCLGEGGALAVHALQSVGLVAGVGEAVGSCFSTHGNAGVAKLLLTLLAFHRQDHLPGIVEEALGCKHVGRTQIRGGAGVLCPLRRA